MYHHLIDCTKDLIEHFEDTLEKTGRIVIDTKNIYARFTAESISATALGFKGNCIKDETSQVFQLAQNITVDLTGGRGSIVQTLQTVLPFVSKLFDLKMFRQSTQDFFKKYVVDEMVRRESQGITNAKDVLQMLIQAKNGKLKNDENPNHIMERKVTDWNDDELLAAQIFIFFAGGFETTSTLMQMCSYELAMNQNVQKELMTEVEEMLETLDGNQITYEALNNLKFLDMVVQETLRKWPPIPSGLRECNKDYRMDAGNGKFVDVKKGDNFFIPFYSIQHDPKYFKNPSQFDPYRFSEENKHKIVPGSFLAFGYGPRLCLGARLALLEVKLVMFTILSKYTFEVCEKTPRKVTFSASPLAYKETVYVELKPKK